MTTPPTLSERILELLADYDGLPLNATDIAEELGASEKGVKERLHTLKAKGAVLSRPDPDARSSRLLYSLPGKEVAA